MCNWHPLGAVIVYLIVAVTAVIGIYTAANALADSICDEDLLEFIGALFNTLIAIAVMVYCVCKLFT